MKAATGRCIVFCCIYMGIIKSLKALPVSFAGLLDVGLEERCHCIADEGVQGLVRGILTQGQNPQLA